MSSESVETNVKPGRRRSFPAAYKLKIVRAAAACTGHGEVCALLRREGLYSSHLGAWRKQLSLSGSDGLASRKRGRKAKHDAKDLRIAELEKRTARLTAKLSLAEKLLALQKKHRRFWASISRARTRTDGLHRAYRRFNTAGDRLLQSA